MSERTHRTREVTTLYLQIQQQLQNFTIPQWLELDLTFQQMKVLYTLKQHGPLKMSVLSEKLKVSMPTITGIVSRLVERKEGTPLIARLNSPEDRRQVWAHLTEAGLQITNQLDAYNQKALNSALAQLNDGEIEDARMGLTRISNALNEQRPVTESVTINFDKTVEISDETIKAMLPSFN